METIRVVLDARLLKATDLAAKRQKVNRSALIRNALRQHLKRLRELELEEQDRRGYLAQPQREEEFRIWEDAAHCGDEVIERLRAKSAARRSKHS
jgi:metal-responsive CopG/Arc/MetJ family transcriptional regulator